MSRAGETPLAEPLSTRPPIGRSSLRVLIPARGGFALWVFPLLPAAVLGAVALRSAELPILALSAALLALVAAIARTDARRMIIPDRLSGAVAALGFAASAFVDPGLPAPRLLAAVGAMIGLEAFRMAFRRWRGVEGLGFGDVKLVGASTAWIGIEGLPSLILIAAMTALVSAMGLRLARGRLRRLPFGPHLAAALWLVWSCGPLAPA